MLKVRIEKSFKKDVERDKNSGAYSDKDFQKMKEIVLALQNKQEIDVKHRRHFLKGDYKNLESIHIKNDWILIFRVDKEYLNLVMLGKHTQVYKKFK